MNDFAAEHFQSLSELLWNLGLPSPDIWLIHGPTDPHMGDYSGVPVAWIESDRCVLTAAFDDHTLNHSLMFRVKTSNKSMEEPDERTD
jgi:hypothetical protein